MSTKKIKYNLLLATTLAASFISTIATAQQSGERRGPPPEAIEACANQSVDAACSFTSPRGEVIGQCMSGPQNTEMLACAPAGGPRKQGNNG